MYRRLFSATSSDDVVDVDEDDMNNNRWSDLESEMDLDQVVYILIQSKTSNEVRERRTDPHILGEFFLPTSPPTTMGFFQFVFLFFFSLIVFSMSNLEMDQSLTNRK
jgi:hypothetical protein